MSLELAYIVHRIPGRVRLRIRGKRQDQAYFEALCRQLQPLDCVEDVRANCNTGSIILRYAETPYAEVEAELRQLQLFDIAQRKPIPLADDLFANPWSIGKIRWAGDLMLVSFVGSSFCCPWLPLVRPGLSMSQALTT